MHVSDCTGYCSTPLCSSVGLAIISRKSADFGGMLQLCTASSTMVGGDVIHGSRSSTASCSCGFQWLFDCSSSGCYSGGAVDACMFVHSC